MMWKNIKFVNLKEKINITEINILKYILCFRIENRFNCNETLVRNHFCPFQIYRNYIFLSNNSVKLWVQLIGIKDNN